MLKLSPKLVVVTREYVRLTGFPVAGITVSWDQTARSVLSVQLVTTVRQDPGHPPRADVGRTPTLRATVTPPSVRRVTRAGTATEQVSKLCWSISGVEDN